MHRGQILNTLRITYLLTGALRGGRLTPPASALSRKCAVFREITILVFIVGQFITTIGESSTLLRTVYFADVRNIIRHIFYSGRFVCFDREKHATLFVLRTGRSCLCRTGDRRSGAVRECYLEKRCDKSLIKAQEDIIFCSPVSISGSGGRLGKESICERML